MQVEFSNEGAWDFTAPIVPASSPLLRLNSDPLLAIILPPSALTVVVPLAKLFDSKTSNHQIGTGIPKLGVLQTSGIVAMETPLLPL